MDISQILSSVWTWVFLAALHLICWAYAFGYVRPLRHDNPDHEQTAWLVVVGSALVGIFASAIVGFASGIDAGVTVLIVLLVANIVGGIPMIHEYTSDTTKQKKRRRDQSAIRQLLEDE